MIIIIITIIISSSPEPFAVAVGRARVTRISYGKQTINCMFIDVTQYMGEYISAILLIIN